MDIIQNLRNDVFGADDGDDGIKKSKETILPLELCHVPGIIDRHMNYTRSIAAYPNERTIFLGALAFLSFAAGRRYRTDENCRPNIYIVCVARSGAGKDAPRKANMEIANRCGCLNCVPDGVGSGEGLEDKIMSCAKVLLQTDEFDTMIRAIAEDKSGNKESLVKELLTMFSTSGGFAPRRLLANGMKPRTGNEFCKHPHLTVFGSATPKYFYESLNERVIENGLLARCLVADCGIRGMKQKLKYKEPPEDICREYRFIMGSEMENGVYRIKDDPMKIREDIIEVGYDELALSMHERNEEESDREYHKFDEQDDEGRQAFLARSMELETKLEMLYAISKDFAAPKIDTDAVSWAHKFVQFVQQSMFTNIETYTSRNEFDANCKRVIRKMRKSRTCSKREISRCLRLSSEDVNRVIVSLIEQGMIEEVLEVPNTYKVAR